MSAPATVVRPPWSDEFPRLADAFPGLSLGRAQHLRVLAVPATATMPERLVGVASLVAPAEGQPDAALLFGVRPRFAADAPTLLAAILEAARTEKYPAIVTRAAADQAPHAELLRTAGFVPAAEKGFWRLTMEAVC